MGLRRLKGVGKDREVMPGRRAPKNMEEGSIVGLIREGRRGSHLAHVVGEKR